MNGLFINLFVIMRDVASKHAKPMTKQLKINDKSQVGGSLFIVFAYFFNCKDALREQRQKDLTKIIARTHAQIKKKKKENRIEGIQNKTKKKLKNNIDKEYVCVAGRSICKYLVALVN